MRHLIIYAHPNDESLNHSILNTVTKHLESQNHEIITRDLYKISFDPVLSLDDMQRQFTGEAAEDIKRNRTIFPGQNRLLSFIRSGGRACLP